MTLTFKRPMLAASLLPPSVEHTDENILAAMQKLKYPVLATLKLDGIRAIRLGGSLVSRTLKQIPNRSIRERSLVLPAGFDMELWNPSLSYDRIESIVMSREHKDSDLIQFHVLDWFGRAVFYNNRLAEAFMETRTMPGVFCEYPTLCADAKELLEHFLRFEGNEGEGICFRLPNSPYKMGRSTLREQYLVKLARFKYDEAMVIGFVEQQENTNSATTNAVGLTERSSETMGLRGKDTLGAFKVRYGVDEFTIGTGVGLDDRLRQKIWNNQSAYLGKTIKFKYKSHGTKDLPRSPVFVGFRNMEIDG